MKKFRKFAAVLIVALLLLGMIIPLVTLTKTAQPTPGDWSESTNATTVPEVVTDSAEDTKRFELESRPEADEQPADPTTTTEPAEPTYWMELTDEEIWVLATTIYLEGRGESVECQKGICSVILNRMTTREQSLHDVIFAPNQFSVAGAVHNSCPDDTQIGLVHAVLMNNTTLPECVTFFRAGKYHDSKTVDTTYIKPYIVIDNTYFSHDIRICGGNH